jgi:hypothetical protein
MVLAKLSPASQKVLIAAGMPCAEGEPSASGSLLAQPQLVEATLPKSHRTA